MSNLNSDSSPEMVALNNVINKLQIYMDRNKQTLHGLATTMGFAYQPFYRLMTKKHLPTISSFGLIASHLNCSIAELSHENVFLDINYYSDISEYLKRENSETCRIYIPYEQYRNHLNSSFFAIQSKQKNIKDKCAANSHGQLYELFYSVDNILMDGTFLAEYKDKKILINVLSISSKFIIIEENSTEVKVDIKLITPIAKFFSYLELTSHNTTKLFGIKL